MTLEGRGRNAALRSCGRAGLRVKLGGRSAGTGAALGLTRGATRPSSSWERLAGRGVDGLAWRGALGPAGLRPGRERGTLGSSRLQSASRMRARPRTRGFSSASAMRFTNARTLGEGGVCSSDSRAARRFVGVGSDRPRRVCSSAAPTAAASGPARGVAREAVPERVELAAAGRLGPSAGVWAQSSGDDHRSEAPRARAASQRSRRRLAVRAWSAVSLRQGAR